MSDAQREETQREANKVAYEREKLTKLEMLATKVSGELRIAKIEVELAAAKVEAKEALSDYAAAAVEHQRRKVEQMEIEDDGVDAALIGKVQALLQERGVLQSSDLLPALGDSKTASQAIQILDDLVERGEAQRSGTRGGTCYHYQCQFDVVDEQ